MYHMSSLNTDKTETCQGLRFKVSFNRLKQVTGGLKRPIKKKFDPRSGILHIVGDP